jgi:protein O-GlcNAc transferase
MSERTIEQALAAAVAHHKAGRLSEAEALYAQAVRQRPDHAEALHLWGIVAQQLGHSRDALDRISRAAVLRPEAADFQSNLGMVLVSVGRSDEAINAFNRAVTLKPDYAEAYNNLAVALKQRGRIDESIAASRRAIELRPKFPEAWSALGVALDAKGLPDEAIAAQRRALLLRPDFAAALTNLANSLMNTGRMTEAIGNFARAASLQPDDAQYQSNLLRAALYDPGADAQMILREHQAWGRRQMQRLPGGAGDHHNDPSPERRLRVGYVSADFREHVVGQNLLPLLREHDRKNVEVFCYASVRAPDGMTEQFRRLAGAWRDIRDLSDDAAAEMIRADRIDILIDLGLHTAHNRLPVFARKPAPVQVSYLGYCGTTGLPTIGYRLTDPYLDPPGRYDADYSEQSIRLPRTYWCYESRGPTHEPGPLPAVSAGHVTFGSLNHPCKLSPAALALWSRVVAAAPGSRILIHTDSGSQRKAAREHLAAVGIGPDRIAFVPRQPWPLYVRTFDQLDIALDALPFGGGITTCDALWMGVPVVTLRGATSVGRGACSILSNVGLPELIGATQEDFVRIAVELASDLPRLSALRAGLRQRMERSPLRDAQGFARDVEAAYRQMWQEWCRQHTGQPA